MRYRTTRRADADVFDIYSRGVIDFGEPQAERYHAGLLRAFEFVALIRWRLANATNTPRRFECTSLAPIWLPTSSKRITCSSSASFTAVRTGNGISDNHFWSDRRPAALAAHPSKCQTPADSSPRNRARPMPPMKAAKLKPSDDLFGSVDATAGAPKAAAERRARGEACPARSAAPPSPSPTPTIPPPTSRCWRGWSRCGAGRACISAAPTRRASITSSPR